MTAPRPPDEEARIEELQRYEILDTPSDASFDSIVELAAAVCGTSQAYVTLVDRDRQWFKSSRGALGPQTPRDVAFCAHTIMGKDPMIVEDAKHDERFAANPLVLGIPRIRFYAGVPLISSQGHALGTLCVIDEAPRTLNAQQRRALVALGRQVELQLELQRRWLKLRRQADSLEVSGPAPLPPALIALAVHDLKSPLTATLAVTRFLLTSADNSEEREAAETGIESAETAFRMLADLMDVVLGRNGSLVTRVTAVDLGGVFARLRRTMTWSARERRIQLEIPESPEPKSVITDPDLLRRILENLVDNALKYAGHGTVTVRCEPLGEAFEVRVSDSGRGIEERFVETIFEPRVQAQLDADPTRGPSRGLGLYFCRLAATSLGGSIRVERNDGQGTTFLLTLPQECQLRPA